MLKKSAVITFLVLLVVSIVLVFNRASPPKKSPQTEGIKQEEIRKLQRNDVYLGAWAGGFWDNDTRVLKPSALKNFENIAGRKMAIANTFIDWTYLPNPELLKVLNTISDNGWVPMVTSNPSFFKGCPQGNGSLYKTIARGDCDQHLKAVALNLKSYQKPILLRFAWEMNLPDMYWSIDKLNSTPDEFIQAWRHFHDVLKQENTNNVKWVLSFNTSHPGTVPYAQLYPGDEYVDWVAIDGYNWGDSHDWSGWASFSGVFKKSYDELIAITRVPVMISEVNSAPTGGDKAKWLKDMLTTEIPQKFPRIEAVIFFNENKNEGESVDWRIEKSPDYITAFKHALDNNIYKSSYP